MVLYLSITVLSILYAPFSLTRFFGLGHIFITVCSYFYHSLFLRDSCVHANFAFLQSWAQISSLFCIFNSNPYFLPRPAQNSMMAGDLVFSSLHNLEECLISVIEVINYAHSMDSRHPTMLNTNRTTLDFSSKLSLIIMNCIH